MAYLNLNLFREIVVDNFAGGGGASIGIEMATGLSVDIAINHDPDAKNRYFEMIVRGKTRELMIL